MAGKITDLAALTAPAHDDLMEILDVSDTSMAATGTNKKITRANLLSALFADELSITGATTATIGRMHVCSGTSADYTLTLPAASGNAGKLLGVRMAGIAALSKLVTLDGNSSETIDGALTRIMWANEAAILLCDGSNWFKIAGKSIAMSCSMSRVAAQNINTTTVTKVLLDTVLFDTTGVMGDTTNSRINIARPSLYTLDATVVYTNMAAVNGQARVNNNGSLIRNDAVTSNAGAYPTPTVIHSITLAAADQLTLDAYQTSGGTVALFVTDPNILQVWEVPQW